LTTAGRSSAHGGGGSSPRRLTIRLAVAGAILAISLSGCGEGGADRSPAATTVQGTLVDRDGDGTLERGPGEPLADREELARRRAPDRTLATFGLIADAHVNDEESPARLEVLDRLGAPFASTFRPHEALSAQVLAAGVSALNRLRLDAVVETGDLVDGAQANEYAMALPALAGGRIDPDSGRPGYDGVQASTSADPAYYRPGVDPPRHRELLRAAERPLRSPGLRAPWYPVAGNHDLLVAGILAPSAPLRALATGARRIVELPRGLRARDVAAGDDLSAAALDGRPRAAALADRLLREGRLGRTASVPPDPARRPLDSDAALARLRAASGSAPGLPTLDYAFDIGSGVRGIALDSVSRRGGSGGTLTGDQLAWLARELVRAGSRWVVVFSHQPLSSFTAGRRALDLLDRRPRILAAIAGHTHRNRIEPRRTVRGGYWLLTTASLADYPQQVRVMRVRTTAGGAALETWLLDTSRSPLADTARELAYLDAQGGRPGGLRGHRRDRNARLFVSG